MSPDRWQDRVRVMLEDIERIHVFIADLEPAAFKNDEKTVFAVCYAFVRLGEAIFHLPAPVMEAHPEVEWGEIRHFRNFMVHVYPSVDPSHLYETAKRDLGPLAAKLRAVLAEHPD
ncbi:MAG: HepT-like ribonuclease domain-containing protein [Phycisphaerales bacterium]